METQATYKYKLDTSSKKFVCPDCNRKTFVKMKDFETGEYLPDHVGRCDRENNCGYQFTLKQYLAQASFEYYAPFKNKITEVVKPEIIDFMPIDFLSKSMNGYKQTHFALFLTDLFGNERAEKILIKYFVGRSRNDHGKACIFWRIDKEGNVRTGKIMCYNHETGKRNKEINPSWVHSQMQPFNFKLCFFGEHLLTEHPEKKVGLVESEKTAIIASIFMPDMVWLATGGNSGCKWREYDVFKVLQNRTVILFPDFGYFNKKTERTCFEEWSERAYNIQERINCSMKVSRVLEDQLEPEERINDFDLADLLIKRDPDFGCALTDDQYPAMWNL